MHSLKVRSTRKSTKVLAGGALLAVCAAGGVVADAHADWSTQTSTAARFVCDSGCQRGDRGGCR